MSTAPTCMGRSRSCSSACTALNRGTPTTRPAAALWGPEMDRVTLPPSALVLIEDAPRRRLWRFSTDADFDTARGSWFLSACTQLKPLDVVMYSAGLADRRMAALGMVSMIHPDGQTVVQVKAHFPIGEGDH